jgi:intracellular sulfur oxidation DsrE/DsrF family protein
MTTRSTFLAVTATGAALAAAAHVAPGAVAAGIDEHAMNAILAHPARHKQVIGAPRINLGAPLRFAGNGLNAFQFALGQGAGALKIVAVFYGTSLFYVFDDAMWDRYKLFDALDRTGDPLPTIVHGTENPFYHARTAMNSHDDPHDERGFYHDFTIESLTRRGVSWFACDNALRATSKEIARSQNADPQHVYDDLRTHLVPGTTIVPAGVAAIVLAQEARFTFLPG